MVLYLDILIHCKCKQDLFWVSGFWNNHDSEGFFLLPVFHLKCVVVRYDICLFWLCWKVAQGVLWQKLGFSLWKSWQSKHFVSVAFGSADGVQSSNIDKKQAATRHSVPCGKLKCQTRKNLCIAYTQVNTHAHFSLPLSVFSFFFSMKVFHTEDTHLRSGREPPDTKTAKVHLINSWQARACSLWHRKWSD